MNDTEFKQQFGKRVKELRLKNNLTQQKFAELIDVGERNLSKIECGKVFVKATTIAKMIEVLKVEPSELFDFAPYKEKEYIKNFLINEIINEKEDVFLIYRIYKAIKYSHIE